MKTRTCAAAALAAGVLGMALAPSAAHAHDGPHPFKNCTAAYEAGYAEIEQGDSHYGKHLDRDGDGVGCDQPPEDFEPADDATESDTGEGAAAGGGTAQPEDPDKGELADTGGESTVLMAAGGGLVLVAGAGVLLATSRRHRRD
jgi:LPXTG-motif cell wall-anchored protein